MNTNACCFCFTCEILNIVVEMLVICYARFGDDFSQAVFTAYLIYKNESEAHISADKQRECYNKNINVPSSSYSCIPQGQGIRS